MDEDAYDSWAKEILEKNLLTDTRVPFWQAPFYPYFLAFIYSIGGYHYLLVRLIQVFLGLCNCVLIFYLTRIIFGDTASLIAFFIASFYGLFVFFEGQILNITLVLSLNLALFLVVIRAYQLQKDSLFFYAGILFGISIITRPTILIFLPFLLLWIALESRKYGLRRVFGFASNLLFGLALVISITMARNYLVSGEIVPVSTYDGINFYIGNNPNYEQTVKLEPGAEFGHFSRAPQREGQIEPFSRDASRFWYKKAFGFIRKEPISYLGLLLKKFYLFWNGFEIARYMDYYWVRKFVPLLKLPFINFRLISPIAICGILLCAIRAAKKGFNQTPYLSLLFFFTFSCILGVILSFVTSPYRVPAAACLIIFASFFIGEIIKQARNKNLKFIVISLIIGIIFAWITNSNLYRNLEVNEALNNRLLCSIFMRNKDYAKAVLYCNRAVRKNPYIPEAWACISIAYFKLGNQEESSNAFIRLKEMPQTAELHELLGEVLFEKDLYNEASEEFKQALRLEPGLIHARKSLSELQNKILKPSH